MLRASDVAYEYAPGADYAVEALSGVSVDVRPGRVLLVAGPTGSGKTTLLRLLAGLVEPSAGEVRIGDAVPQPAAAERERRIGLLFQSSESQLFADTVLEDVAFGPANLGFDADTAQARAVTALERVGVDPVEFGERSPFTLSGGEARRVALAGVLSLDPAFLLLDEPTAGLDAFGRAAVRQAVRDSARTCGVVVVTHDVGELLDLADDVLLLRAGHVQFSGDVGAFVEAASAEEPDFVVPEILRLQVLLRRAGLSLPVLGVRTEDIADAIAGACGR